MSSHLPASSGIYRIVCVPTGRFYVGSAVNLQSRRREHLHGLRQNKHHSTTLQRAFTKYGEDAFLFELIELVLPPFLIEREQYWLDTLKPFGSNGFNTDPIAGSRYGSTHTLEAREKLRLANLGKTYSEEVKRKHSEFGKTRKQSEATKEKVRLIRLGTKRGEETRERLRASHLGKKQSEATIEKRRMAQLGRPVSDTTREKLSSKMSDAKAASKKTLIVIAPDGTEHTVHGIGKFCKEHNLNHSALIQVAKGHTSQHKGWKAHFPPDATPA